MDICSAYGSFRICFIRLFFQSAYGDTEFSFLAALCFCLYTNEKNSFRGGFDWCYSRCITSAHRMGSGYKQPVWGGKSWWVDFISYSILLAVSALLGYSVGGF